MLTQTVSVVIPVYRAGAALRSVVLELLDVAVRFRISGNVELRLDEIILVCDNPALAAEERIAMARLEDLSASVQTVWLARNFGQHPATAAGIVSTNSDWVVTMDEDGQHDPSLIPDMLRTAARAGVPLVYAKPTNPPPHGVLRNGASRTAKSLFRLLSGAQGGFHSFRLVEGSIARSACAYIGENVYLDVAMQWSCGNGATCPIPMRDEEGNSSYSLKTLLSHFSRMVLSTGTPPLRMIAVGGVFVAVLGLAVAVIVAWGRLSGAIIVQGWTSVMITLLLLMGGLFISLSVVAEYVGFAVRNAIGKPLYVKSDHADSRVLWNLQAALRRPVAEEPLQPASERSA